MYAEFSPIPTMLFKQNISRILKVDVFGYVDCRQLCTYIEFSIYQDKDNRKIK